MDGPLRWAHVLEDSGRLMVPWSKSGLPEELPDNLLGLIEGDDANDDMELAPNKVHLQHGQNGPLDAVLLHPVVRIISLTNPSFGSIALSIMCAVFCPSTN